MENDILPNSRKILLKWIVRPQRSTEQKKINAGIPILILRGKELETVKSKNIHTKLMKANTKQIMREPFPVTRFCRYSMI